MQRCTGHRALATLQNYDSFLTVVSVTELQTQMGKIGLTFLFLLVHIQKLSNPYSVLSFKVMLKSGTVPSGLLTVQPM